MLTRNSGLVPPPDALQDPPEPNPDDDSVAGMPDLVDRRADYDSSDDEDMTNYDDEGKNDDDEESQDNGNEEEENSSATVNPGDYVLISADKCRISTRVNGDDGHKVCVCPRSTTTCNQHRSHVMRGTKTRHPVGFYLRYPRNVGTNRDVPGLLNGPFFTVDEMVPIIAKSRAAASKVGRGGYESEPDSDYYSDDMSSTGPPLRGPPATNLLPRPPTRPEVTPVDELRDSLHRSTTPATARRQGFSGDKEWITCMMHPQGKKRLALNDDQILKQCMRGFYTVTTVSTGAQAAAWLAIPEKPLVEPIAFKRIPKKINQIINVDISVNSSDTDDEGKARRGRQEKKRHKKVRSKSKSKSKRNGRLPDYFSDSSSSESDSDSSDATVSDDSSRRRSVRRQYRSSRHQSRSSSRQQKEKPPAPKEVNTGRKDPSTGTSDQIYEMNVQSSAIDVSIGPPHLKSKEVGEIYDIAPDILSIPGTSLNVAITGAEVGSHMADALFRRSRYERAVKKDTTFNSSTRHALKAIHDQDSLLAFADALDEEEPHTMRHFEGAMTTFMVRRHYADDVISEYRTEGGLAQLISKTFLFYKGFIEKIRQEVRKRGWNNSPARAIFEYHSKELLAIRRHAITKKDLVLGSYIHLRDARDNNFYHEKIGAALWDSLAAVTHSVPMRGTVLCAPELNAPLPTPRDAGGGNDKKNGKQKKTPKEPARAAPAPPPPPAQPVQAVCCSHCRSGDLHRAFLPPISIGKNDCPFRHVSYSIARSARRLAMAEFNLPSNAHITSIDQAGLLPFIEQAKALNEEGLVG